MAEEQTLGTVVVEIRDLLKSMVAPPLEAVLMAEAVPMSVVPRPKATGWLYREATLVTGEMTDIVHVAAKTGAKLAPTCVIVRVAKASNIDVCLTPLNPEKSEIIAPGTAPDNGVFMCWFPYGIYTIGTSEGKRKFWVRAQGITVSGKGEAAIMYEEVI